ncbi:MAG: cyclic nucleotide-binding domain-containing protein [Balneolales bacterium]|nr:cyclic nucleotide-binding domain-containing protein [Balneolales bacterium]
MEQTANLQQRVTQGLNNVLKSVPLLFRNFSPEDLRDFLKLGHAQIHRKDDIIIDESSTELDTAFLIVSGKAEVWKDEIHLATISEGDILGETFLFNKIGRTASVSAQDEVITLKFKRAEVLEYFRRKPERLFKLFTMNIVEIQQRRISTMNARLLQLHKRLLNKDTTE